MVVFSNSNIVPSKHWGSTPKQNKDDKQERQMNINNLIETRRNNCFQKIKNHGNHACRALSPPTLFFPLKIRD